MKSYIYGAAMGPTDPGDSSVFDRIIEKFPKINKEDCIVKTYDEYNFISVQVPTYQAATDISSFKDDEIKVTMIDVEKIDENAKKFWSVFESLVRKGCVNFARAQNKLRINLNYSPNVSTLLFFSLMYSIQNNIMIDRFNFSNCNISKIDGFTSLLEYFPNLRGINLSGNKIAKERDLQYYFGSAKIITNNPSDDFFKLPAREEQIEAFQQDDNDNMEDQNEPVFQSLCADLYITLDMFPSIQFDIDEFPTNRFICHYFKLAWEQISSCENYYSDDAVFSVILQNSPMTMHFINFDSDFMNDSPNHYHGKDEIIQVLQQLFPYGFKANITAMNCSIISENIYLVIIHGVFESDEQNIYGFDRSFFIDLYEYNFRILNDNIFIREPPNIYE